MGSASRSSFFGFEIAKTGLFISQHNLNVTGHNISNVNTPGYTRQRLVTSAIEPYSTIGRLASYEKGILGGGTQSHYIEQLRSEYLDREFRLQNSNMNTWSARLNSLEFVEQIFDEPNEVGVLTHLQDFHNALNDLVADSPGQAQRTELQSAAKKLTETFNQYYRQLVDQQAGLNEQVKAKTDHVNSLSAQIGELNKLIYNFEITGEQANDLRDTRNLLLDQLSSLVQIEVTEYSNGNEPARLSVSMGTGKSKGYLVDHTTVNKLYTDEVANRIQPDTADDGNVVGAPLETVTVIMWGDATATPPTYESRDPINKRPPEENTTGTFAADYTGDPANEEIPYFQIPDPTNPGPPQGMMDYSPPTNAQMEAMYDLVGEGEINGLLTMRDGDHSENVGIPNLVHQLDTWARTLVREFNALHNKGYCDSSVEPGGSQNGIDFFWDNGITLYEDTDPPSGTFDQDALDNSLARITAGTFRLDDDMTKPEDVWRIACSDVEITDSNQEGNNHNTIDGLLGLFDRKDVGDVGSFNDYYKSFLLSVGFTTDFARTQQTSNEILAVSADTQRMSISAVSIDEEVVNMVKFQHAFAASSRVITAMDEALDRIINSTGVVGR